MASSEGSGDEKKPFVGLSMLVSNSTGETKRHAVELTLTEFQKLRRIARDAMRKLDMS